METEETPSCPAQRVVSPPPALPASTQASACPRQLPPLPAGARPHGRRNTCLSSQHPGPSSWACCEPRVSPRRRGLEPPSRVCCVRASSVPHHPPRALSLLSPLLGPTGVRGREETRAGAGALRRDPTLLRLPLFSDPFPSQP